MKKFKQITGVTFLVFGIFGIFICLSYIFSLDLFRRDDIFGKGYDGTSSSNGSVIFGLIAIAGAILLNSENKEIK